MLTLGKLGEGYMGILYNKSSLNIVDIFLETEFKQNDLTIPVLS